MDELLHGERYWIAAAQSSVFREEVSCLKKWCPLPSSSHLLPLPGSSLPYQPNSVLRRWQLCRALARHFWQRWSDEYLTHLARFAKWNHPNCNFQVGDLGSVSNKEDLFPTKWPIALVAVHPGRDGLVRVITVKTTKGTYKRPVTKVNLVLPSDISC